MTLYEIDEAIMNVINNGFQVDEETGEVILPDTEEFEALQVEQEKKWESIALWVKEEEAQASAIKAEIDKLKKRMDMHNRKAAWGRDYETESLLRSERRTFETSKVSITFRKSESVVVDPDVLPKEWQREKTTWEPNKTAIKAAIKGGQEIPGAAIEVKQNLQIN